MAKKKKEKIHITLLGKGYSWKTKELEVKDGCFIFNAKMSVERKKNEETRKIELYPGADTDVLVDRPLEKGKSKKSKKNEESKESEET